MDTTTVTAFVIGLVVGPLVIVGGLAGFVWLRVRRQLKAGADAGFLLGPPALPLDAPLPLPTSLATLDGEPVDVAALVAGRPVVLNFWATWCGPCVLEWPTLERLRDAVGDDVAFVLASSEDADTIRAFVAQHGYRTPVYRLTGDLPPELEAEGIPSTFVLRRDLRLAMRHEGAADWAHDSVVAFVRGLAGPVALATEGDCADGVCAVPEAAAS